MKFFIFYNCFFYTFSTRIKTVYQRISFLFIYFIPLYLVILIDNDFNFSSINIVTFFVGIIGVYSVYEIGYIFNDVYAIRKEQTPTYRLSYEQRCFVEENIKSIVLIKLLISILSVFYIDNPLYSFGVFSILFLYAFYNQYYGLVRLPLHFFLSSLRYCLPLAPFSLGSGCFLLVIFLFPLINTIERMDEKKFSLIEPNQFILSNKKSGRYFYYLLCTSISVPVFYLAGINFYHLVPFIYFGCYRFFSIKLSLIITKLRKL